MPRCLSDGYRFVTAFRALSIIVCVVMASTLGAATPATWDGTTGNWSDAARWSTNPVFPNNIGPDLYDAVINAGAVSLDQTIVINQLALAGGNLGGTFPLTLMDGLAWSGGTLEMTGAGQIRIGSGTVSTISGAPTFQSGRIVGGGNATLNIVSGVTLNVLNQSAFFADPASPSWTLENAGIFVAKSTSGAGFTSMDARFNNLGTIRVETAGSASHTLSLAGGGMVGGMIQLDANTTLELGSDVTLDGATITGSGVPIVAGFVTVLGNVDTPALSEAIGELRVSAGGTIHLTGSQPFTVDDGIVSGVGTIDGDLDLPGGTIAPGPSAGALTVTGAVTFAEDATLAIELGGANITEFDRLIVGQTAQLNGGLGLRLSGGFTPASTDTFTILSAAAGRSGVFSNAPADGFRLGTTDGLGSFVVKYTADSVVLTDFIPEPGSAILFAAGGAALLARRSRMKCARNLR